MKVRIVVGVLVLVAFGLTLGLTFDGDWFQPASNPASLYPSPKSEVALNRPGRDLEADGSLRTVEDSIRVRQHAAEFEGVGPVSELPTLRVSVKDERGTTLPGAHVSLRVGDVHGEGIADARGIVSFVAEAGRVVLRGVSPGPPVLRGDATLQLDGAPEVVPLILRTTGIVRGRVIDYWGGFAIAGAIVQLPEYSRVDGIDESVVTGVGGRFELKGFPLDVMAGVSIQAEHYGDEQVTLAILSSGHWEIPARFGTELLQGEDGAPEVSISLVPEKVIKGSLPAGSAATIQIMGRYLIKDRLAHREVVEVESAGAFNVRGLRSDITHSLRVIVDGYARFERVIGPTTIADLGTLEYGHLVKVRGHFVTSNGERIPGLPIRLDARSGESQGAAWDTDGGRNTNRDGWRGLPAESLLLNSDQDGGFEAWFLPPKDLSLWLGVVRSDSLPMTLDGNSASDLDLGPITYTGEGSLRSFEPLWLSQHRPDNSTSIRLSQVGKRSFAVLPLTSKERADFFWPGGARRLTVEFMGGLGEVLAIEKSLEVKNVSRSLESFEPAE